MNNQELDMERSPQQYKEYIQEISQVDPDYPFHGNFMIVDHHCPNTMGGEKQCFRNLDLAVQWAEYNLDHNDYSVYQLTIVL